MEKKKKKKKKKKDHKFASNNSQEVIETNDLLIKEDQNQTGPAKNTSGSSSHDNNPPPSNHQYQHQPIFQWPNTAQSEIEKSPLTSKPCIPINQSALQPTLHLRPNPSIHQAPHLAQQPMPFWLAQQNGFQLAGANETSPYRQYTTPVGTTDVTCQGPGITNGDFSARSLAHTPSFSYHVGYPYPRFPGPWDPSSWWAQQQQSLPPYSFGYFPLQPPPVPSCSSAPSPPFQRGIIRPPAKLSQKHQKLWEAQSAENVQLRNVISHLQSELEDQKTCLNKLEAELTSLRPKMEEPPPSLDGKITKRGRPKRKIPSNDHSLLAPDKPHPRARAPMLPQSTAQTKELNFEKESGKKIENNKIGDEKNSYVGMTGNANFAWPTGIYPVECGNNLINNISAHNFYSNIANNDGGRGRKVDGGE